MANSSRSRTTSITIGTHLDEFVEELVNSGRYGSTSEVVRSALRLLEQQEAQVNALRYALEAGAASGESELSLDAIAQQVKRTHGL
ncbi:type II toxin-antitoxin system ParD family antitoxin [Pseudidiomarina aquimaris]|uniref:Antitoxin ParD n=1 Tax=Pseudidiomarina aquimaris TaxID=641841 RepID=A0A432XNU9_9GAMM|nr:type II toxin-antitoxin system ParD family antitoxin [Pseudidiomarina aquimaris]RUO50367.1 type II toxin-antitoxin system ParD family antitoxin [Pseudidiomarina aquimaris]|tara:strand:+ start:162 stop:419 length:258 start_codon:yes stop_codon:yes gene_type:complete